MIVAATVTLPWTAAVDLEVSKPANAMGQFFTETFRRRTGKPLAIVIGDVRTAGLVALASPDRPSLYVDGSPALAPWLSDEAVREKGAILIWTATDTAGTPPAALKARFPDMVAEVPRSFDRSVQGRLPLAAHRLGGDPAALIFSRSARRDRREIALDRPVEGLLGAGLDDALEEVAEHLVELERRERMCDRLHAIRRQRNDSSDSCA